MKFKISVTKLCLIKIQIKNLSSKLTHLLLWPLYSSHADEGKTSTLQTWTKLQETLQQHPLSPAKTTNCQNRTFQVTLMQNSSVNNTELNLTITKSKCRISLLITELNLLITKHPLRQMPNFSINNRTQSINNKVLSKTNAEYLY